MDSPDESRASQLASGGSSHEEIIDAALAAAHPQQGLRWLDVGCGRGDLLRRVRDEWAPAALRGIDTLDWLDEDLRGDVAFEVRPAEELAGGPAADRVLLIEVIEHLEAPWSALRAAARVLAPDGWLVLTTPNLSTLRHRLELATKGTLTSFRPGYDPHLSPALPHVSARVLGEEGLEVQPPAYAGADVISFSKGRAWPQALRRRYPRLGSVSVILAAHRPPA
ncbi:MAG TPA: methyltransferase domain-containing protein [Solirubrobacteraceae bacterium]|nr:methyltransferase domain-containing protein [Solirubrobacteraceae bacterium]